MEQRYYATNQTNRNISLQLSPININTSGRLNNNNNNNVFGNRNIRNNQNLFNEATNSLQRSLSRQQQSLTRNKKHHSSKGSIHNSQNNRKNSYNKSKNNLHGNLNQANQIVQQYMQVQRDSIQIQQNLTLKKFQFKLLNYIIQITIAYALIIGIMYLIKITNFPFYLLIYVFGLLLSITNWYNSNIIMLVCCFGIIANYYLQIQILTYPIIIICYFCIQIFNQQNKCKLLYIPILICTIVWGFIVIPTLFIDFVNNNNYVNFYYVFPIFILIIRTFIYIGYRQIKYSEYIYLQLPFFILGIQYGVIMTLDVNRIQFWYLIVLFTLTIINDRTQFILNILISVSRAFVKLSNNKRRKNKKSNKNNQLQNKNNQLQNNQSQNNSYSQQQLNQQSNSKQNNKQQKRDISILAAHTSGYSSIHSLHIICLVYIFTKLPIYSPPYTSITSLTVYIDGKQYLPVVVWVFGLIYQLMCLVLERKRPDKYLIGFVENGIWNTIQRGIILSVGFWLFYLGLGIGTILLASVKI